MIDDYTLWWMICSIFGGTAMGAISRIMVGRTLKRETKADRSPSSAWEIPEFRWPR